MPFDFFVHLKFDLVYLCFLFLLNRQKKRMINGDDMGRSNIEAGIIHMENVIGENQYFGTKPLLHPFSIPSHLEKVKKMQP